MKLQISTAIKRIIKKYYKYLYANKCGNEYYEQISWKIQISKRDMKRNRISE